MISTNVPVSWAYGSGCRLHGPVIYFVPDRPLSLLITRVRGFHGLVSRNFSK